MPERSQGRLKDTRILHACTRVQEHSETSEAVLDSIRHEVVGTDPSSSRYYQWANILWFLRPRIDCTISTNSGRNKGRIVGQTLYVLTVKPRRNLSGIDIGG